MANEFKHATAGTGLTQAEFEATDRHTADSQAQGDILYCDGTYWLRLAAGTNGQYLQTQGAGANPQWATPGTWTDWTPTVTQSSQQGVTVTEAKYSVIGSVCHIYGKLVVTSSGTAGQEIVIGGQPAATQPAVSGTYMSLGNFVVLDSGTVIYAGSLVATSTAAFRFQCNDSAGKLGATPSFALANNDEIDFSATYPVA